MGPDFLDKQSLWYMFCCNFISLLFLIFSSRISGKRNRISGATQVVTQGSEAVFPLVGSESVVYSKFGLGPAITRRVDSGSTFSRVYLNNHFVWGGAGAYQGYVQIP